MRHSTTSYPIQIPEPLWDAFTAGPAASYNRLNDRVLVNIALDTLRFHDPEELDAEQRQLAVEIVEDTPGLSVPDQYQADDPPPADGVPAEDDPPTVRSDREVFGDGT